MNYDKAALVLYIITLIAIVVTLPQWEISIVIMLVLIIVLLQKMSTEGKLEEIEWKRAKGIDNVAEKLDVFANKAEALKQAELG